MILREGRMALLAGVILVLFAAFAVHAQDVRRISKEELKAELGGANLVVIDVRIDHDWDISQQKIAGAVREEPNKVDKWMGKYPKDKKIVLYCA